MRSSVIAKYIILFYVLIAIFHPFIANDKSLLGGHYSAPIPYSASTIQTEASFSPPFTNGHILGTDILGRDVLAGLLNGTEIAVKIGFFSVFIAALIALFIGLLTAYANRFPIKVTVLQACFIVISIPALIYIAWISSYRSIYFFILAMFFFIIVNVVLWKYSGQRKKQWTIPIDFLYLRLIEAMKAIPLLIFLLALVSVFQNFSVNGLIWILALLMWPGLSRYIRAEALKVLSMEYVMASHAYGASRFRVLRVHVLPKLFTSLSVVLAFSISAAILAESTLSFLGLGVPIDQVSWGSMLKEAQNNINAWWLAVFPGIALFVLILCLNTIGNQKD